MIRYLVNKINCVDWFDYDKILLVNKINCIVWFDYDKIYWKIRLISLNKRLVMLQSDGKLKNNLVSSFNLFDGKSLELKGCYVS